jgi:hypothetical protein
MNKKIKDLVKEAGFVTWANESWGPGAGTIDWAGPYDKELDKFYELVVRECAKEVNNVYKQGGGTYEETILKKMNVKIK